jgi:hypothetical protein
MFKIFLRSLILILILTPAVALVVFIVNHIRYSMDAANKIIANKVNAEILVMPGKINPELSHVVYPPPPVIRKLACPPKTGLITLWFDDVWLSQYTSGAIHLMDEKGFVGALSVPTGLIGNPEFMSWDQIRTLQAKGWETTSHSVSHICDPAKYDAQTTAYELLHAQEQLKSQGLRADNFVMPCGYSQYVLPNVVAFARLRYLSYRRAGEEVNLLPLKNPYNLKSFSVTTTTTLNDIKKWVSITSQHKAWLILVFHQIDGLKLRYDVDINKFNNILLIVKKSGLAVVLPSEVLQTCIELPPAPPPLQARTLSTH